MLPHCTTTRGMSGMMPMNVNASFSPNAVGFNAPFNGIQPGQGHGAVCFCGGCASKQHIAGGDSFQSSKPQFGASTPPAGSDDPFTKAIKALSQKMKTPAAELAATTSQIGTGIQGNQDFIKGLMELDTKGVSPQQFPLLGELYATNGESITNGWKVTQDTAKAAQNALNNAFKTTG